MSTNKTKQLSFFVGIAAVASMLLLMASPAPMQVYAEKKGTPPANKDIPPENLLQLIPVDPKKDKDVAAQATTPFSDYNSNYGCSGLRQNWDIYGYIFQAPTTGNLFRMTHEYPSSISVGVYPLCTPTGWTNMSLRVDDYSSTGVRKWYCESSTGSGTDRGPVATFDYYCENKTISVGDRIVIAHTGWYGVWWLDSGVSVRVNA